MNNLQIASIAYHSVTAYTAVTKGSINPDWEALDDNTRLTFTNAVDWVRLHLEAPAGHQHEAWVASKVAAGWTKGPVYDAERKTHPRMIPFLELPEDERRASALLHAVVHALL